MTVALDHPPAATRAPVRARPSALADLVDYVSDRLMALGARVHEPWFAAQNGRMLLHGEHVEAEVGPFILRTDSSQLIDAISRTSVVAWSSSINVRTRSGLPVSGDALIRLQATDDAAIAMDRLCRLLHMLDHLLQGREAADLWVPISLRHLLAVDAGHGAFFEEVLGKCGLGPERIVLRLAPRTPGDEEWQHLEIACAGYRSRGFQLACALDSSPDPRGWKSLQSIAPDWLSAPLPVLAELRRRLPGPGLVLPEGTRPEQVADLALRPDDRLMQAAAGRLAYFL